jgi:DNA polymerase-4
VRTIATEIEDRGIDEIYIDLTDVDPPIPMGRVVEAESDRWLRALDVAKAIKRAVRTATGLTCSIAIARNKLLAKIASELDKPDGLTLLRDEDIARRIWPLPARKINGVGPKSSARLEALGIRTIGELATADRTWLIENFGVNYGAWLHDAAHGNDERPVVTVSEPKSISRETTFDRDLDPKRDREALTRIFTELCDGVSDDLRRKSYVGKTIGLKLRFDNFKTVTRDHTIEASTQDPRTIRRVAGECLRRVPLTRRIRLLGVRIAALSQASNAPQDVLAAEPTPSLFDEISDIDN